MKNNPQLTPLIKWGLFLYRISSALLTLSVAPGAGELLLLLAPLLLVLVPVLAVPLAVPGLGRRAAEC